MGLDIAKVLTGWLRFFDDDNDCQKIIEANPCGKKHTSLTRCAAQKECETGILHSGIGSGSPTLVTQITYPDCYVGKEFNLLFHNETRAINCAASLNRIAQHRRDTRRFRAVEIAESLIFSDTWRVEIIKPE